MFFRITILAMFLIHSFSSGAAIFTVTNTNDSGAGSLRAAITSANGTTAKDTIYFNIPGAGPHSIGVTTNLPPISQAVLLDGYSQPGAIPASSTSTAIIKVMLNGQGLANTWTGLMLYGGSTVRGLSIVNFNQSVGSKAIYAFGDLGPNNITGNYIGVHPDGITAMPNRIAIDLQGSGAQYVGGPTPEHRNIISGNGPWGAAIQMSQALNGVVIQGNYIGTDHTGTLPLGNHNRGIDNEYAKNTQILDNIICAHLTNGIEVDGQPNNGNNPYGVIIKRNRIGIGKTGEPMGNGTGITLVWAYNNLIGGDPADGNIIAHNTKGLVLNATTLNDTRGNRVTGNSFYNNSQLGIDIYYGFNTDNVTPNDLLDTDPGPNGFQNYPVIQAAYYAGTSLGIEGNFNSTPNRSFHIEFFLNPASITGALDATGYGEGHTLIHTMTVNTDGNGNASFSLVLPAGSALAGDFISSTATDNTTNNTSEFSFSREITVVDFGDAPDPLYPTLAASGGACHNITAGIYLGSVAPDPDADGQPSADAGNSTTDGDDGTGADDEGGVPLPGLFAPPTTYTISVPVNGASGRLNAWIDWNRNGNWGDGGEQIALNVTDGGADDADGLTNGVIGLQVKVPCGPAVVAGKSFARFRWSTQSDISYSGYASDGEVEDYLVQLGTPVPEATANAGADRTMCGGGFSQLGQAPLPAHTYQWTPAINLNADFLANPVFSSVTPGNHTYTLLVTNAYGCEASDDVTIEVKDILTYTHIQSDPTCFGAGNGTITITVSGGTPPYSYSTDNGASYPFSGPSPYTISNLTPGNYKIRVKDNAGCETIPCL